MMKKVLLPMISVLTALVLMACPTIETPQVVPVVTPDATIILLDIEGVTVPVTGATPVTTVTETSQYTGTVTWNGTPAKFAASNVYIATITLTAKAGYTLTGVTANSFKVAGASTTNSAGSGVVTAVFPVSSMLTMVTVPAGRFQRDNTDTNISVITQPYKMSAYEITRAQFVAIMTTDPSDVTFSSGTSDPVHNVNWYHAIAFCNKLSLAEGLNPVYAVTNVDFNTLAYVAIPTDNDVTWNAATANFTNNGYRLPTEMEWMWAAMGAPSDGQSGGTNTTGYMKGYAGSIESSSQINIGNYAWYKANSSIMSHPVGTKTANELGLYDMSGNVGEWCWDWYAIYPAGTLTDYQEAASGTNRVHRGGCWDDNVSYFSVAFRSYENPYPQGLIYGFRVVRN